MRDLGLLPELVRKLAQLSMEEQHALLQQLGNSPLLGDLIAAFCRHLATSGLSEATIAKYSKEVRSFGEYVAMRFLRSNVRLDEVTEGLVMEFVLRETNRGPAAGDTLCWRYSVLRTLFQFVRRQGYGDRLPLLDGSSRPRPSTHDPSGLTPKETQALLQQLVRGRYAIRDFFLGYLMLNLGIRASEAADLRIGDVDLKNELIYITRRKQGRGKKPRRVPMPLLPTIKERLAKYMVSLAKSGLGPSAPLFPSQYRTHLTADGVSGIIERALRAIGKQKGRAHVLRHTCAMNLAASGMPVSLIAEYLGHKTPRTTLAYLRYDTEALRQWIETNYELAWKTMADFIDPLNGGAVHA